MPEKPKYTPPTEESEDFREYERSDSEHYSEKFHHRQRTLGNETERKKGHKDHWRKEKAKEREEEDD